MSGIGFFLDDQAGRLHIGPQFFAAIEAVQAGVWPADGGDFRLPVQHRKDRQPMPLADLVVVGIMAGGDLERPGAELARHVIVGDDRDLPSQHRHQHFPADEFPVAFVFRMDGHGRIAQDGLRAGGGDRE